MQGAAVGALMRGIPVANGQFAGTSFDWLHPFPVLTGIGLVFGYALLGAGWIVLKSEGELRDWAYARIPLAGRGRVRRAGPGVRRVADGRCGRGRAKPPARSRRWGLVFPVLGDRRAGRRRDRARGRAATASPFALTVLFFVAAYLTLGVMFWPYMVPYAVTVGSAAAPDASLRFLFYGGVVVLPVIADLHHRRLLGVPRQGAQGLRPGSPKMTSPKQCRQRRAAMGT